MPRIDLWWPSVTRVEIDQRSREARFRLDHLERSLALGIQSARSWLSRALYHHGSRVFRCGERLDKESLDTTLTGPQPGQKRKMPTEVWAAVCLHAAALSAIARITRDRMAA